MTITRKRYHKKINKSKHVTRRHKLNKKHKKKTRKRLTGGSQKTVDKCRELIIDLLNEPNYIVAQDIIFELQALVTDIDVDDKLDLDTVSIQHILTTLLQHSPGQFNEKKYKLLSPVIVALLEQCSKRKMNASKKTATNFLAQQFSPVRNKRISSSEKSISSISNKSSSSISNKSSSSSKGISSKKTSSKSNNLQPADFLNKDIIVLPGVNNKNNNYKIVQTSRDGDCFYSAYYRLARIFKSELNLTIFDECSKHINNEESWIECFKNGLSTRISNESDPLLNEAVNKTFNGMFELTFKEYLYNRNKPKNQQTPYYYDRSLLDTTTYGKIDANLIHPFTKELPKMLEGSTILDPLISTLIGKERESTPYENAISSFNETNPEFREVRHAIKQLFFKGFDIKNHKNKKQYATEIEYSIIKTYINSLHGENAEIIPISNSIFQAKMPKEGDLLKQNVYIIQFIFYKGGQHYEGLFSQSAVNMQLTNKDELLGFGF